MMPFLLTNWRVITEAAVVALLLMAIGFLRIEVGHYRTELTAAESKVTVLQAVNDTYKTEVEKQNAAVQAIKAESDKREQIAREAVASANETAKALALRADAIRAALPTSDLCKSAQQLIEKTLVNK